MQTPRNLRWMKSMARVVSGETALAQRDSDYQLQIYAIALVALVLSAAFYVPVYHFALNESVGAMAIAVGSAGGVATFPLYLATGSIRLALQGMSAAIFTVTSFLAWHQGGLSSPLAPWLIIVPFALSIAGLSGPATAWFLVVVIEMFVLGAMELSGHVFVQHRGSHPEILFLVSLPGLFLVIFAFLFLVNRARLLAFDELRNHNDELSRARDMALEAVREKSRFLANMSHEIRTPLNGILGTADVLGTTRLDPEQQRFVALLTQSGGTLLALVNDVLDFSKIEAGKVTLERVDFDLRELIEGVAELFAAVAAEKGLSYTARVAPSVPTTVSGDPLRLRQVLSNLLSNALKFTSSGEVAIEAVPATAVGDGADGVRFRIIDSGIGIDDAVRDRLFKAFSQADDSTTRVFGGTGLGLVISGELVRLMGGQIQIDSTPGRGSCFTFVLAGPGATPSGPQGTVPTARRAVRPVAVLQTDARARVIETELLEDLGARPVVFDSLERLANAIREQTCPTTWLVDADVLRDAAWNALPDMFDGATVTLPRIIVTTRRGLTAAPPSRWRIAAVITHPLRRTALLEALADNNGTGRASPPDRALHAALVRRVLLVEDNVVNQQIAMAMLKRIGCVVDLATDGAAAVQRWREAAYDIVLMDCQMPVLDGYDATRAIRILESREDRPRTPILALTANALAGDRDLCMAAGMDDHLGKPFTLDLLRASIDRWSTDTAPGSQVA
jgi:two-component system sensor histidine kinase/response regulator